ncbi:MAG TPA: hypothetical protein VFD41_13130 [Actinomycetales bacterium]|nr:hypothetical protein [Actinomycetales bacterium]
MTPARSRTRRTRPLLALAAVGVLTACAVAEASTEASTGAPAALVTENVVVPAVQPEPEPTPSVVHTEHVGPRMNVALRSAAGWEGKATYTLAHEAGAADVTVTRSAGTWRVDIVAGTATSSLISTDAGTVACVKTAKTTCVLAAAKGAALPPAFDAGIATMMFTTVPNLAKPGAAVVEGGWLSPGRDAADAELDAAACAEVVGPKNITQYCVTEAGLLVRAAFPGGTLQLVTSTPDVDPAVFTPPAAAVPLA